MLVPCIVALQGPVEEGLVRVDIALPNCKLALFLDKAHEQQGKQPEAVLVMRKVPP